MMCKKGRHGIRIKAYCREHEAYVRQMLVKEDAPDALLGLHALKISWLQHERLAHLIVLYIISGLFLFTIWLFIVLTSPLVMILTAVVLVLLAAYICHYFFLENTVQRWYALYDEIYEKLKK